MKCPILSPRDAPGAAWISECRRYRYLLTRCWRPSEPTLGWIMLNPSVATAIDNDPTIVRIANRSRMLGYGSVVVANLFALRSPDPAALQAADDPVGPENDEAILVAVSMSAAVVCAWGSHGALFGRSRDVRRLLVSKRARPLCLGTTSGGDPKHPLYIPYEHELEEFLIHP